MSAIENGASNSNGGPAGGIALTIVLQPDGQVQVHGPLQDKILCFGLLEIAKLVVAGSRPPQIAVPQIIPPKDFRNLG